jgi:hypothetical protein
MDQRTALLAVLDALGNCYSGRIKQAAETIYRALIAGV